MDEENPLISVIIPVYNQKPEYLNQAIDSVLRQTYKNLELIIVDDGSDKQVTITSSANNIKVIRQENKGVAGALNTGIKEMKGEWFAWLSSDDIWYPEKLEKQIELIKKSSAKIIYSDWEYIDETGEHIRYEVEPEFSNLKDLQFHLCHRFFGCGSTVMIHKECFEKIGMFNEEYRGMEDYEMWFRLAKEYMFYKVPLVLMKYRSHINALRNNFPNYGGTFNEIRNNGRKLLEYDKFKISVVIIGKNVQDTITKCIHRIKEHPKVNEIIIINDGSTDKTQYKLDNLISIIRSQNVFFEVIQNRVSMGRGAARNIGLKKAKNPMILSVDGDIIPESGFINRLLKVMDDDPFLDVIAGSLKWKSNNMGKWGEYYDFNITQTAKRQIGTALTLFKKSALEKVNYLDDKMSSGEDSEMFFRMQKQGIRFAKVPDLLGTHIEKRTLFEMLERHYQYGKDRYYTYMKHRDDMQGQFDPKELEINPSEILQLMKVLVEIIGTLGFREIANSHSSLELIRK